ncbi:MAG: ComEC/Rec2 family competence protein [Lactobacillaceae bacterium]|jgi:competence protein ComEC|nr:ComEC/Rec2 family competence protein [Lactobacillaceae bacterium]
MKSGYWLVLALGLVSCQAVIIWQQWWCVVLIGWFGALLLVKYARYGLLSGLVVLCMVSCYVWQRQVNQASPPPQHVTQLMIHPDQLRINGDVVNGPATLATGERVYLRWILTSPAQVKQFKLATRTMTLVGKFECSIPDSKRNRYSFDFRQYMYTHQMKWQVTVKNAQLQTWTAQNVWQLLIDQIRTTHLQMVRWFERLPPGLRDYGETLLLGYTRQTFYADNLGVQKMGLVHLFSISGFQVMAFYAAWRWLGKRGGVSKEPSLFGLQIGLLLLWLFAGCVVSLVRPVLLALFSCWKELGWLRLSTLDLWGLTLLLGLLFEPGILQTLGGQLSYCLSFGLLWLVEKPLWQVSLYLGVLIMPILVWHTFEWHPAALVANIVGVPLFSVVILPLVLVGVLARLVHFEVLVTLTNSGIELFRWLVAQLETLPGNLVFGQPPLILVSLIFGLLVLNLAHCTRRKNIVLAGLCVVMYLVPRCNPVGHVIYFDVGQGDATLFVPPFQRQVFMLDVGGQMQFKTDAWRQRAVSTRQAEELAHNLKGLGIGQLDGVVLTHKDADHLGNFNALAKQIPIKNVYFPSGMELTTAYQRQIKPTGIKAWPVDITTKHALPVQFLHPFEAGKAENEDSIVLIGQFGPERFWFSGDLDQAGELKVASQFGLGKIDNFKFGHHGSHTSTAPGLIAQIQPQIGIVSAGRDNRFKHPRPETLQTAQNAKMRIYNTQVHGMVDYMWFGNKTWWRMQLNGADISTTKN